jgi:outer membrane protein TolC
MRPTVGGAAVVAALLIAVPWRATKGEEFSGPVKLGALVDYARSHNPEIRAAAARARAARARPAQAGSLPDPMIDVAYHNESFDRLPLGSSEFTFLSVGVSQELAFPGKLGLKREVASYDAEQADAEARRVEVEIISRLKMAYAEYAHLDQLLDILHRNQALLEKFARIAEAKYGVGEGIQQDVLKAHVEMSLLVDRETTLDQRRQSQVAELNALLNRQADAPLGMAEHPHERTLGPSLDELLALAEAHAPVLHAIESRVAASESNVGLAQREYWPDFVVRGEYMQKAALLPEWEVGLGIKVPLYFATKQRSGVDEAAAMLIEARAMRAATAVGVQSRIKDLFARAKAAERLAGLYHTTVIPQAQLALESATTAYQVGKIDFLTLINSFTVMLEYEMRYHEELSNFQKTVAELEAVIGQPLE